MTWTRMTEPNINGGCKKMRKWSGGADGGVRTPGQEPTFHSSSDMNGCKEGLEIAVPLQSTCLEMEPWIICCLDSAGTSNMCGFFTGVQDEAILSIV